MKEQTIVKPSNETATDLKELYQKIESETIARNSKRSDKRYSANDIRLNIRKIFKELELSEVKMTTIKGMLISSEQTKEMFKDVKYQEIRSVVLSKKFEYDLVMIDDVSTIVKK